MNSTRRAIVLGTGAGGLAAAAHLAKDGFEVLALERSDHLGGYMAPFSRDGFLFDPGVHYMGGCRPGGMVHRVLAEIGIDATGLFCEMDPDGFDVYQFPDLQVRMCRPIEAYAERLRGIFPEEKAGIDHFFHFALGLEKLQETLIHLSTGTPALSDLGHLVELPSVLHWLPHTLADLLDDCIEDYRLKAVLAAQGGDYGLPASKVAAVSALLVMLHYRDGAFFPRGGSGALRDAIVAAAKGHGARFMTRAEVKRIHVEHGRVTGVDLANGEHVRADLLVSDADPTATLGRLVDPSAVPRPLRRKVARTEPSLATFSVFLGMKRDLRQHGLGASNLWIYPTWDVEGNYRAFLSGRMPEHPGIFVSPNSLKDDSGAHAPPGCSTLELSTFAPFSMFEEWQFVPPGERGPEYAALKERITEQILREVEACRPGLIGDVVVREASSPLSATDWVGVVRGGPYGPAATPAQAGIHAFRTRTPIENLFLAGAGVLGGGVGPCMLSGVMAARAARKA